MLLEPYADLQYLQMLAVLPYRGWMYLIGIRRLHTVVHATVYWRREVAGAIMEGRPIMLRVSHTLLYGIKGQSPIPVLRPVLWICRMCV